MPLIGPIAENLQTQGDFGLEPPGFECLPDQKLSFFHAAQQLLPLITPGSPGDGGGTHPEGYRARALTAGPVKPHCPKSVFLNPKVAREGTAKDVHYSANFFYDKSNSYENMWCPFCFFTLSDPVY